MNQNLQTDLRTQRNTAQILRILSPCSHCQQL